MNGRDRLFDEIGDALRSYKPTSAARSSAARVKRYRERQKHEQVIYNIELEEYPIIEALLDMRRITERDSVDKKKVEAAIAKWLRDLIDLGR